MDTKEFLEIYESIKTKLIYLNVEQSFNSIGSNIFFDFGGNKEICYKNKEKIILKEWMIWISQASWRIIKNNKYCVGSSDDRAVIQSNLENFIGKRLLSFEFISQFLDICLIFEGGYQVTTFFNHFEENQWSIRLPDRLTHFKIDCSNQEKIKKVQGLIHNFPIIEVYKRIDLPQGDLKVLKITYDKNQETPIFIFQNKISICLINCTWRLEKNNQYVGGMIDDHLDKTKSLSGLVGKKLKQIEVANPMMDARFEFDEGYVLKTFTCTAEDTQWDIWSKETPIFEATIELGDQI